MGSYNMQDESQTLSSTGDLITDGQLLEKQKQKISEQHHRRTSQLASASEQLLLFAADAQAQRRVSNSGTGMKLQRYC